MKSPVVELRKANMPRLSAHEMAALILLSCAPVEIEAEDLDMAALRDAGLAQRIDRDCGRQEISIMREGREVLRVLNALTALEGVADGLPAPDS